jgi:antitoxin ParD1/3/4
MGEVRECRMADVTISMPQVLLEYADEQIETGRYADIGDFLRDLVRRDSAARDRLWAALDEGEASGVSELTIDEIIARAREKAQSRAA